LGDRKDILPVKTEQWYSGGGGGGGDLTGAFY